MNSAETRGGEVYRGRGRGRPYVGRVVQLASTVSRRDVPRVDRNSCVGNQDSAEGEAVVMFPHEPPVNGMDLPEYEQKRRQRVYGAAGRAIKFACSYMPIKWKDAPRGFLARLRSFFK